MNKLTIFIVLALLFLNFNTIAQAPVQAKNLSPQTIAPLKVGDKLPETFWQQEHTIYTNGKTSKQTLAQHKGKLLILDFWATWCGSCINKFRTIAALQNQFNEEVMFILVNTKTTRDTEQKIDELLSGRKYQTKPYLLTSIYNDSYLNQLFPHAAIPHFVFIDQRGKLAAMSNGELMTALQFDKLLAKEELK